MRRAKPNKGRECARKPKKKQIGLEKERLREKGKRLRLAARGSVWIFYHSPVVCETFVEVFSDFCWMNVGESWNSSVCVLVVRLAAAAVTSRVRMWFVRPLLAQIVNVLSRRPFLSPESAK